MNDGTVDSSPDTVTISTQNLAPIANAGPDLRSDVEQAVRLDGSGSNDPEGVSLTYDWSIISRPEESTATLSDSSAVTPQLTLDAVGNYVAQLIVNDGELFSIPDTVSIESTAVECEINTSTSRVIPIMIHDFTSDHPDFEILTGDYDGLDAGMVKEDLGTDRLPVYVHEDDADIYLGTKSTHGSYWYNMWYRATDGWNIPIEESITITKDANTGNWHYQDNNFFPIDGRGWGNSPEGIAGGLDHNFHFTMKSHLEFDYNGGEFFTFTGDDDLLVFINGKLAVDLGGVHMALTKTINLDDIADYLGISVGNTYSFDLFFAERHTSHSRFHFETSMNLDCINN